VWPSRSIHSRTRDTDPFLQTEIVLTSRSLKAFGRFGAALVAPRVLLERKAAIRFLNTNQFEIRLTECDTRVDARKRLLSLEKHVILCGVVENCLRYALSVFCKL
jgi:hypothetical protein